MRLLTRALPLAALCFALAACSGRAAGDPVLAFVPADAPAAYARTARTPPAVLDARLSVADAALPAELERLRTLAGSLDPHAPALARALRAAADEMQGKTTRQLAADAGVKLGGRFAAYLTAGAPVVRFELDDPAAFERALARLSSAAHLPLSNGLAEGVAYRTLALGQTPLRLIAAHDDGQGMLALVPQDLDERALGTVLGAGRGGGLFARLRSVAARDGFVAALRRAVGMDAPKTIEARLDVIAKAAKMPATEVGFVDTGELFRALSAGARSTTRAYAQALGANDEVLGWIASLDEPPCRSDLARVAARVPEVTYAGADREPKVAEANVTVALAPDLTAALAGLATPLPGLAAPLAGGASTAWALPLPQLASMVAAQVEGIALAPFTCPALEPLNVYATLVDTDTLSFTDGAFGFVRGVSVALDALAVKSPGDVSIDARLIVAVSDVDRALAVVRHVLPGARDLDDVPRDGRAHRLPDGLAPQVRGPAFIAASAQAVGVSVGADGDAKLDAAMAAPAGGPGALATWQFDGRTVAGWMRAAVGPLKAVDAALEQRASGASTVGASATVEALAKQYDRLERASGDLRMTPRGLVMTTTVTLR